MEINELKNKTFLIMGLGVNGGGLETSKFLLRHGASLIITDLKTEDELRVSILELEEFKSKIKYVLGRHEEIDFLTSDIVIKNPGVRSNNKFLKLAKRIETDISLFLMFNKSPIIAITGSKGKSTLSYLIYDVIRIKYPNSKLGGNIGISPLSFLDNLDKVSPIILELSSWQLHDLKINPIISIITNIYNDHQNSYSSFNEYIEDKANIFLNQRSGYLIIENSTYLKYFSKFNINPKIYLFSEKNNTDTSLDVFYLKDNDVYLNESFILNLNENRIVIKIAKLITTAVSYLLNIDINKVSSEFENFIGLPHRLEFVRKLKEVFYYNDSTTTIPDSTVASVKSLKTESNNIILITGGTDKKLDFSPFYEILLSVNTWILLNGSATEKIINLLEQNKIKYYVFDSLNKCVEFSRTISKPNDIVLMSPASASFELFKNEFDRGNQFKEIVNSLV